MINTTPPYLTSTEIMALITQGKAYVHMVVHSITDNEDFYFNGVQFVSTCSERTIGVAPTMVCDGPSPGYCQPISESYGELLTIS